MITSFTDSEKVAQFPADHVAKHLVRLRDRHRTMLWLSTAIVACALTMQISANGRVAPIWLDGVPLPELCGSRNLFGIECPGCGLTRSFIALARGDFAASIEYHRLGWLLALAVLIQFPYRVLALLELRSAILERNWPAWFGWALIALLIGNWLARVVSERL